MGILQESRTRVRGTGIRRVRVRVSKKHPTGHPCPSLALFDVTRRAKTLLATSLYLQTLCNELVQQWHNLRNTYPALIISPCLHSSYVVLRCRDVAMQTVVVGSGEVVRVNVWLLRSAMVM